MRAFVDGAQVAPWLGGIAAVLSDLDGVVWRGDEVLPGAPELFAELRRRDLPFAFATNNSAKTPVQYAARLTAAGIPVAARQVVTSGVVTARYLAENYGPGSQVHVLGSPALVELIAAEGLNVTGSDLSATHDDWPQVVVAGMDRELSYGKLAAAAAAVRSGADLLGTNGDPTFPVPGGLLPGTGSIIAALETATGRKAKLLGKPEAPMFEYALQLLGAEPARTVMIGDRLDTDVLGARRAGLRTALVLTGATTAAHSTGGVLEADLVVPGMLELLGIL